MKPKAKRIERPENTQGNLLPAQPARLPSGALAKRQRGAEQHEPHDCSTAREKPLTMPKKHAQLPSVRAVKQPKKRSKPGHPSPYEGRELELVTQIAARVSKGETMISVCGKDGFPDTNTLYAWAEKNPAIASILARAKLDQMDSIANDCLTFADDLDQDPNRSRVQIDTRLKLLAKWDPKRYGEAAQQTTVNVGVQVNQVSMEELAALAADKREAIEYLRSRG